MSVPKCMWAFFTALALATVPAAGCDIFYPADYVPSTSEELISQSRAAFIGHVIAYRLDDGSTIPRDIDCSMDADFESCWDRRNTIVSAILSVDIDIRGMGGQLLFEDDRSAEPGADCGNYYADDTLFLVTGFGPDVLNEMPSKAMIESWRSLPFRR
jgi:hypothetical protein